MRIGHGYDAHRFGQTRPLVLGGVTIPHRTGLKAHSDGDVLIHALCDAMLGAAALGDIGRHFPDSDEQFKNVDSRFLLRTIQENLRINHYFVGNADITVIAQAPKLSSYMDTMCEHIAEDLEIHSDQVNIKATTTEGMGFMGREEGIACHAVVLLLKD
ncbi:2-C-methyl-D-erythritol 2,4-cyclodiphosphate synthase [Solemya velum gill symbiont]|uniref:2-C-methyl-D-erythritol 2,4-cyclodiphosphate synthase n=1 Tax=Solemya velum gill symbiont TaxID=2340 RepID=A0A0B0HEY6_SOVGS|nr:2-C-methyl-D-erythritol 2,4-cyclodiphosphate synthase [Solemya velum gill symbiont]KHF26021.1 2C-methyl D-erythritol 2,4-cyclodiphosphate synthase [Solemya velum gill symbiont]OOY33956.1 2-C-methyl-D-erythritol 2,4-cyclodiphosphate synthase [Solemya velum gill symbiont]OOY36610.1 2-C-methyl-D-erythritol 2,4-cyclodiphosphate synthase [Solemya velum gill symbiont]OOY39906.1 2-C-methyl-D-erythritol 2,4-cyclodiphosphate synthase [Solemya velum gill symbiont]OOY41587.1 2-C-methyl-D-erythritol 2,